MPWWRGYLYVSPCFTSWICAKERQKERRKRDEISLEDLIEKERAALGPNVTRITLESFLAWKKRKREERIVRAEEEMEKRKADFKAGKSLGISGREVFEFRPELVDDDDEEADDTQYTIEQDEDETDTSDVKDIDLSRFVLKDVDETGITVASNERFSTYITSTDKEDIKLSEASGGEIRNGEHSDFEEEEEEESDDEDEEDNLINDVPVDENLFTGEDLDELEEQLNTLEE
ncbi:unnamed protein product [Staurois parvus]|uniref:ZC3H15/TMA46 family C-terminal domain-containing protein n=1 Tax=Staurois parvus TaxID=386267 RepID=A0ABN9F7C1_9NEOB|nr:unnamed protein product [Staurois parvus]